MALVSMKMSREEAQEVSQPEMKDAPEYPYGLCIDLDDDALEKLGITTLPKVGSEMLINAKVVVKSVSSYDTQGGESEARASLQITDMEIASTQTERNNGAATLLYGGSD
jgi:hypothetical protein